MDILGKSLTYMLTYCVEYVIYVIGSYSVLAAETLSIKEILNIKMKKLSWQDIFVVKKLNATCFDFKIVLHFYCYEMSVWSDILF